MSLWTRFISAPLVKCACSTGAIRYYRKQIIPHAFGRVLEVGCGDGQNFKYYDPDKLSSLIALEPEPVMIRSARKKQSDLGSIPVEFIEGGAERLPLDDKSVDCVIITFVLCTIPDWNVALREVKRVLKPNGKILFGEHGLSPELNVQTWQRRIEPVWKLFAGGCHLTRKPEDMLTSSGFKTTLLKHGYMRMSPKPVGYVTQGEAVIKA